MTIHIIYQTGQWIVRMLKAISATYIEIHRRHANRFPQYPTDQ